MSWIRIDGDTLINLKHFRKITLSSRQDSLGKTKPALEFYRATEGGVEVKTFDSMELLKLFVTHSILNK